jgi:hypothetical protein
MRVFVSSLIGGFGAERAAARAAIKIVRHEPVMAEDFGAQPTSPQIACLQGLRNSDFVILILGEHYGELQGSGLSPTHEEYREAKDTKPVVAFVQSGITPDPQQLAFIKEVEEWQGGLLRGSFADADELRTLVTQALHDYDLTVARAPVDADALKAKAANMLPHPPRNEYAGNAPTLDIAVVGGPAQQVIRPAMMDDHAFGEQLQQTAQFGATRLFDTALGTDRSIEGSALILRQESGAEIKVDESADLLLRLPLGASSRGRGMGLMEAAVVLEEDVSAALRLGLEFASNFLDEVDPTQRLSHLATAVALTGRESRSWRTRAEHEASPNSFEMRMFVSTEPEAITLDLPRPGIRLNRNRIGEDLLVRLRRQWRSR